MPSVRSRLLLLGPACAILVALLVLPLGYLLRFSLYRAVPGRMTVEPGATLANYAKIFLDPFYRGVLLDTVWLSVLTTAITLLAGFPLAYFLWRAPARWKGPLTILVVAPLLISIVVRTYGWMVILGDNGVVNVLLRAVGLIREPITMMFTQFAVVVGLTHVQLPFMVLSILAALERIDPAMSEAAETLGASRWRTVRHVILPLAAPGVAAGTTLVFSLSISAFVTPALMGGSGTRVLTTLIYQQFVTVFNWPFGAAVAAVLLAVALGIIFIYLRALARRGGGLLQAGA